MSKIFDSVENTAADLAARLAPWLLPLVTAALVYRAVVDVLHWAPWHALATAAGLELFGFSALSTTITLWSWARQNRQADDTPPWALAALLSMVYFAIVTALVVVVEVAPEAIAWTPLAFPTLSLCAAGTLALRTDHRRRLAAVQADKAAETARQAEINERRRATRAANKAAKLARRDRPQFVQDSVQVARADRPQDVHDTTVLDVQNDQNGRSSTNLDAANEGRRAKRARYLDAALDYLCTHPDASYSELGRHLDVSKSAAANYAGELVTAGKVKKNGAGWEPVEGVGQ